jgi:hypothetical protein
VVPSPLKILKVLIVELSGAAGSRSQLEAAAAAAEYADEGSDDGEWEDEPNVFADLNSTMNKEQLMAFANEEPGMSRQQDNETQAFLVEFFERAAHTKDFPEEFAALSVDEQQKLKEMSS